MPTILCIADVPGWAFDRNVRDMASALADEFDFKFWYMTRGQPPRDALARADAIYCAYRWDLEMPDAAWRKAIGSLRCEWFDTEYPGPPVQADADEVNRFGGGFHTVTRKAYEDLRARCPKVCYLTNPVDTARIGEPTAIRDRVVASWSGHARHPHPKGLDVKGFETVVLPAVRKAAVPFVYAERVTRPVSPARMPDFYRTGNVTLCASLWEGACAVGETPIVMEDGSARRLDLVAAGDRVRARDGSIQNVLRQWSEGVPPELIEITTWGSKRFRFTANHKWPVWAWARVCLCGCGGAVKNGRLWVMNHAGSKGRTLRSIHVHGDRRNRSSSYRAIAPGYEPMQTLRADEIRVGDFLMIPRRFESVATAVSPEEARLLGYYVAEGCLLDGKTGDYGVDFAFNVLERETWVTDVLGILRVRGIDATVKTYALKNSLRVRTKNPRPKWKHRRGDRNGPNVSSITGQLVRWLRIHGGQGATTKRLSAEVMLWPLHLKRELLIGMLRGDGHQNWKCNARSIPSSFTANYGTASGTLALQTQLILAQMGYPANIVTVLPRVADLRHLGARKLSWSSEFYHLTIASPWAAAVAEMVWGIASKGARPGGAPKRAPRRPECRVDDDFVYLPVKAIRRVANEEPVYNLTVSGDHSYLVSNVATYNSNSVMEAMAAGHAVISTECGNVREMRDSQEAHLGASGIEIVPRSPEAFTDALAAMTPERVAKMGASNREEIRARWSWDAWRDRYATLLWR